MPMRDEVREELGNPGEGLISDTTLDRIISEEGNFYGSVRRAAEILSRHFTLQVDKALGDKRIWYSQRAQVWQGVVAEYKKKEAAFATPYVGGISKSDKKTKASHSDRIPSDFWRGMFEEGEQ